MLASCLQIQKGKNERWKRTFTQIYKYRKKCRKELLGPGLSPAVVDTCITASYTILQGCRSPALYNYKQLLISHLNLFMAILWGRLLHAFSWPISCIMEPFPMVFFDLKNWPWKYTTWWNTPVSYWLGDNTWPDIRGCNRYGSKNYPFLLGLVFF